MARRSSLMGGASRCGLFGSLAFSAVQVGFGGLAGGEEEPAGRSGAVAVTGNRDHAGRVSVTAPIFPVRAVLPRVPVLCAPPAAGVCRAVVPAAAGRVAVTARGQDMHAVAVAAAVRSAHQARGDIPRAVIVAPGVGLELFAADAAGADNGLASVPAVAGVVDQLCRLLDDRHLLDPAARLGRSSRCGGCGRRGRTGIRRGRRHERGVSAAGPSARRHRSASAHLRMPAAAGAAAPGTAGRDERQGYAREQGNQGHDGHDDNDQARPVHGIGPPSRIWRAVAGPGGSALGGAARWAGSRISS